MTVVLFLIQLNVIGQTIQLKLSRIEVVTCKDDYWPNTASLFFVDSNEDSYRLTIKEAFKYQFKYDSAYYHSITPSVLWADTMVLYLGENFVFSLKKIDNMKDTLYHFDNIASGTNYRILSLKGYFLIPNGEDRYIILDFDGYKSLLNKVNDKKRYGKARGLRNKLAKMETENPCDTRYGFNW